MKIITFVFYKNKRGSGYVFTNLPSGPLCLFLSGSSGWLSWLSSCPRFVPLPGNLWSKLNGSSNWLGVGGIHPWEHFVMTRPVLLWGCNWNLNGLARTARRGNELQRAGGREGERERCIFLLLLVFLGSRWRDAIAMSASTSGSVAIN